MSVATSYAKALFEAAQSEKLGDADLDQLEARLGEIVKTIETNRTLERVLTSPVTSSQEKIGVVQSWLKVDSSDKAGSVLLRFMETTADKRRLGQLKEILSAFRTARLRARGAIEGTIWAADPVGAEDLSALGNAFSAKLGKQVVFRVENDPSLLAGMKILVGGVTYDGTLRSQLEQLREQLAR